MAPVERGPPWAGAGGAEGQAADQGAGVGRAAGGGRGVGGAVAPEGAEEVPEQPLGDVCRRDLQ